RQPPHFTLFPYTTLFRSGPSKHVLRRVPGKHDHPAIVSFPDALGNEVIPFDELMLEATDRRRLRRKRDGAQFVPDPLDGFFRLRSEEHTSELQSRENLVC